MKVIMVLSLNTDDLQGEFGAQCSNPAMSIIGAEDEDFENDLNDVTEDQCTHFNNIDLLKSRPTHLLVFMQHVILQFEPAPLLCYLHADLFKNLSAKETKKQFVEFYNTFLDKGAILRVALPPNVAHELERTRADLLHEDTQRRYVQEVQSLQAAEVAKQLEDFRQKRMMGMTPSEADLSDVESHNSTNRIPREMKERSVAENLLDKMSETHPKIKLTELVIWRGNSHWKRVEKNKEEAMRQRGKDGVSSATLAGRPSPGTLPTGGRRGGRKGQRVIDAALDAVKERKQEIWGKPIHLLSGGLLHEALGVKTRAVDSKKSRGGFFRNKLVKNKRDESSKAKPRGVFPGIPSWIAGNTEVKPKTEAEAEKEKVNPERKGLGPGRGSVTDSAMPSAPSRKSVSTGSPSSLPGLEVNDGSGNNVSIINIPESSHGDGLSSNRLEPPCQSEGGDVSPVGLGGGLIVGEPLFPMDTSTEDNVEKESRKVARSESARVDRHPSRRRGSSRAKQSRSRSDVDLQPPTPVMLIPHHLHPSPPEGPGYSPTSPSPQLEELEPRLLEFEQDPPNWRELAPPEALSSLSKKETKRQEVINELFATEHAHVRMLSVLQMIFYRPLAREELLTYTDLSAIFPNLDEIIEMHYNFLESLTKLRCQEDHFIVKHISTTVLNRFGGTEGEWFQKLTAASAEAEKDRTEKERIQQSAECCRRILNHVNDEVKEMENLLNLKDYQRRLDTSGLKPSNELYTEYKNIDLTQKKMLYEGLVTWKVTKEKAIEVQCVLLGDLLVLLQRQDDKMVLKCQSKSNIAVQEGKQMLSPIIKLDSVFLREVATDRKAFYVIFTWESGAQIYELVAQSIGERKMWTDVIKTAVDDLKKSGAPMRLTLPIGSVLPPLSPSTLTAPLSPTENGGLKSSSDRDKDSLTDDKSADPRHRLIDFLSDKGFDLIGHSNSDQEKMANSALDEVMSLKRLLVGSISLSEDSQPDKENGEEQSERQETDNCQSTEECAGTKGEEERSITAPLVLSQERMEEVCRRLHSLEKQLTRLQTVEEEHHRLQEALSKFSLGGGNFQ
ncbi:hypothetical protein JOQ06_025681 [Pogonophryne albipinna]|uniref:Rho guanine nucleotide exchange factor 1 n=1 Tax=Pogonophryne albipinna TaxID=1090488 RepID=A0AAD6FE43_9TELE|nr:hypothetical protein JOQ06_025681 [Pogonophryne albipinna]